MIFFTQQIEAQVYKYMQMKEMPRKDINDFFDSINAANHSVVISAKSRVKTEAMLKEASRNEANAGDPLRNEQNLEDTYNFKSRNKVFKTNLRLIFVRLLIKY